MHVSDRTRDIEELTCLARELGTHFVVRTLVDQLAGNGRQASPVQHVLPVGLFLFSSFCAGLAFIFDRLGPLRPVIWLLLALNFFSTYVPDRWNIAVKARTLSPKFLYPPLYLENYTDDRPVDAAEMQCGQAVIPLENSR